jgi:hypothetical protein
MIARSCAAAPAGRPFDLSAIAVNLVRQALRCPPMRRRAGG